jgi:hypothetical protein
MASYNGAAKYKLKLTSMSLRTPLALSSVLVQTSSIVSVVFTEVDNKHDRIIFATLSY